VEGDTAPTCPGTPSTPPYCATGDFSCSVTCTIGTPYPPLASPTSAPSCTISGISFHPTVPGAQMKKLWICDNTGTAPRSITFSGTGVIAAAYGVSPSAFDFGSVLVGSVSDPQAFI